MSGKSNALTSKVFDLFNKTTQDSITTKLKEDKKWTNTKRVTHKRKKQEIINKLASQVMSIYVLNNDINKLFTDLAMKDKMNDPDITKKKGEIETKIRDKVNHNNLLTSIIEYAIAIGTHTNKNEIVELKRKLVECNNISEKIMGQLVKQQQPSTQQQPHPPQQRRPPHWNGTRWVDGGRKKQPSAKKKPSAKNPSKNKLSKKSPKLHKGPRGGIYIIKKGKKIYQ